MIEKCSKIYSIFDSDIVFSRNNRINAIQGYDVINVGNVGGAEDIVQWFNDKDKHTEDIPYSVLYRFTNTISGEEWYIGNFLIAICNYNLQVNPRIVALFYNNTILLDNFKVLIDFNYFLNGFSNAKKVYNVGYLSTPHKAVVNYGKVVDRVKLPFAI